MTDNLDRRVVLAGSFSIASALFLGGTAALAGPLPADRGAAMDDNHFMMLSQVLTGQDALDADMGAALFAALKAAGHAPGLNLLYDDIAHAEGTPAAIAHAAERHGETSRALLRGWYVGLVRIPATGADQLVGYEDALMFRAVDEWLQPRSWCGGEPHFWAQAPQVTLSGDPS